MKTRRRLDVRKRRTRKTGGRNRKKGNSSNSRPPAAGAPPENSNQQSVPSSSSQPGASSSGFVYGIPAGQPEVGRKQARGATVTNDDSDGKRLKSVALNPAAEEYVPVSQVSASPPAGEPRSSSSSSPPSDQGPLLFRSQSVYQGALSGETSTATPPPAGVSVASGSSSSSSPTTAAPAPAPAPAAAGTGTGTGTGTGAGGEGFSNLVTPPPESAAELRHILITAAFRDESTPARNWRLFPSLSTEEQAKVNRTGNPLVYHISSACGSRYEDLAARLTYALRDYDPGTPYYGVALELVTACLERRINKRLSIGDKNVSHDLEIQLIRNLKTAIENCQAMGVKSVTVTYIYVERIRRDGKKVVDGLFHVDIPTRIRTVTNLDGSKSSSVVNGYEASRYGLKEI